MKPSSAIRMAGASTSGSRRVPYFSQRERQARDHARHGHGRVPGVGHAAGERGLRRGRRPVVDGDRLPRRCQVDHHHAFAAEPARVRLGDADGKGGRHGRIHGVAACAQHDGARIRGERVRRCHDASRRRDRRTRGCRGHGSGSRGAAAEPPRGRDGPARTIRARTPGPAGGRATPCATRACVRHGRVLAAPAGDVEPRAESRTPPCRRSQGCRRTRRRGRARTSPASRPVRAPSPGGAPTRTCSGQPSGGNGTDSRPRGGRARVEPVASARDEGHAGGARAGGPAQGSWSRPARRVRRWHRPTRGATARAATRATPRVRSRRPAPAAPTLASAARSIARWCATMVLTTGYSGDASCRSIARSARSRATSVVMASARRSVSDPVARPGIGAIEVASLAARQCLARRRVEVHLRIRPLVDRVGRARAVAEACGGLPACRR